MSDYPNAEVLPDEQPPPVEAPQAEPELEVTGHDLIDTPLTP